LSMVNGWDDMPASDRKVWAATVAKTLELAADTNGFWRIPDDDVSKR
jgi:hypothetical protein